MTSNATPQPASDNLTQDAAAAFLGLKNPRTLAAWRLRQQGPAYVRLGSHVRYRRTDLEAYLAANRVEHDGHGSTRINSVGASGAPTPNRVSRLG